MSAIKHALGIARRYAEGGSDEDSDEDSIDPIILPGSGNQPARIPTAKALPPLPLSPDQKYAMPEESFTEQREREVGPPASPPLGQQGAQNLIFGSGMDVARPIAEGPTVTNTAAAAAALPFPAFAEGSGAKEVEYWSKQIAKKLMDLHGSADNAHQLISNALLEMSPRADTAVLQHLPPSIRDGILDHRLNEALSLFKQEPWEGEPAFSDAENKEIEEYYAQQQEHESHEHALATGENFSDPAIFHSAIKPLDWSSFAPTKERFTKEDIPNWDRAMKSGFNPNAVLWRGSKTRAGYPPEWKVPSKVKDFEPAVFLSDQKHIARSYADNYGESNVTKWIARGPKVGRVDWTDIVPPLNYGEDVTDVASDYDSHQMDRLVRAGHQAGYDMLVIHNMLDQGALGEPQTQYAVLNPAILRAPHAKFDPKNLRKSIPLAGIAGGGLFTYGTMRGDQE